MRLRIMVVGLLLLASVIAVGAVAGCTPGEEQEEEEASYTDISAAEAKQLIDDDPEVVIIDVSPSYAAGHLPEALNYPVGDGSLDTAIPMLDENSTYLVYCHFESASRQGAQKLVDAGFTNVYRLDGGYGAWVDAGYPVET